MKDLKAEILSLSDGLRPSHEIAALVGRSTKIVRKIQREIGAPRRRVGARPGAMNSQYRGGRCVDHDGYATVLAPAGHPNAILAAGRTLGRIKEHRLVLELAIGRYLLPEEVVDHIDGLTLHNAPQNLRIFRSNSDHIAATTAGARNWSPAGLENIGQRTDLGSVVIPVNTHRERKVAGVLRLRQILLLALSLGTDSRFLAGTTLYTERAEIDMQSRPKIELALAELESRWALAPHRSRL